jgi:hypothetical protein
MGISERVSSDLVDNVEECLQFASGRVSLQNRPDYT